MNKTLLCAATAAAVLASCQRNTLKIEAQLDNLPDGKVYLSVYDSVFNIKAIDTTRALEGHFVFDGKQKVDLAECLILSNDKGMMFPIFAGNDDISITGDIEKMEQIKVEGSEYFDAVRRFGEEMPETQRLSQLQREFQSTAGDIDRRQAIKEEIEQIQTEQLAYVKKKIFDMRRTPVGPFLLANFMKYYSFDEMDNMVDTFKVYLPEYKYVRTLSAIVESSRAEHEALQMVEIGRVAPDFTLTDINGQTVTLSQLRGKTVLLDFWASWCLPCRRNNETLRQVYNKFADKNIEIVGVSIDDKADDWREAVSEDKLPGIQLLDADKLVSSIYCVHRIPSSYLIDEQGVIVSKDVDIQNIFENLFGNK